MDSHDSLRRGILANKNGTLDAITIYEETDKSFQVRCLSEKHRKFILKTDPRKKVFTECNGKRAIDQALDWIHHNTYPKENIK